MLYKNGAFRESNLEPLAPEREAENHTIRSNAHIEVSKVRWDLCLLVYYWNCLCIPHGLLLYC